MEGSVAWNIVCLKKSYKESMFTACTGQHTEKIFLHQRDLDKPFTGGLGSFRLYGLLAYHLEQAGYAGCSPLPLGWRENSTAGAGAGAGALGSPGSRAGVGERRVDLGEALLGFLRRYSRMGPGAAKRGVQVDGRSVLNVQGIQVDLKPTRSDVFQTFLLALGGIQQSLETVAASPTPAPALASASASPRGKGKGKGKNNPRGSGSTTPSAFLYSTALQGKGHDLAGVVTDVTNTAPPPPPTSPLHVPIILPLPPAQGQQHLPIVLPLPTPAPAPAGGIPATVLPMTGHHNPLGISVPLLVGAGQGGYGQAAQGSTSQPWPTGLAPGRGGGHGGGHGHRHCWRSVLGAVLWGGDLRRERESRLRAVGYVLGSPPPPPGALFPETEQGGRGKGIGSSLGVEGCKLTKQVKKEARKGVRADRGKKVGARGKGGGGGGVKGAVPLMVGVQETPPRSTSPPWRPWGQHPLSQETLSPVASKQERRARVSGDRWGVARGPALTSGEKRSEWSQVADPGCTREGPERLPAELTGGGHHPAPAGENHLLGVGGIRYHGVGAEGDGGTEGIMGQDTSNKATRRQRRRGAKNV
ncbi:unnamed protein product, partial [Discosporangium mesarthrocarpum]